MKLVLALAFVTAPLAVVAGEPATGSPLPSDPVFSAFLIDGTSFTGRIRQITPAGDVALVPLEGPERTIPFGKLLKLTRDGVQPAPAPEGSLVLFPEGDRLYRSVIAGANDKTLEVQAYAIGNISIPLESLLGLVFSSTAPDDADSLDHLLNRVRTEPRKTELLWLANGDRVAGSFLGLDDRKIKFNPGSAPVSLDRSGVVALGFDPQLVVYPRPHEGWLELTLSDGSRLGVSQTHVEQGQIVARTRFGSSIRISLVEVVRLHTRSDAVVYLSERKADAERYVAYVGPTRPYRRDSSVDGHPFRLAGQTYDRGIGTQSRTLLAYRLPEGSRRFQALVGVDEGAGPLGSVVFRVFVADQERFVSPPMSARDVPKAIDIDVTGAKSVILMTEFGERGEVRDFADWVEARIIR